jgi:hypothetical protein
MKRVVVVLLVGLMGCGGVTFQSNTLGGNTVTASGFVTFVSFTAILDGNGTLVNVTVVTLVQTGAPQTFTFCGSQNGVFPLNQDMRVSFTPATTCGNIVTVVHL